MSNYEKIVPIVNKITKKYDSCDHCLGRLFSKQLHLTSNKLLGKKLNQKYNISLQYVFYFAVLKPFFRRKSKILQSIFLPQ